MTKVGRALPKRIIRSFKQNYPLFVIAMLVFLAVAGYFAFTLVEELSPFDAIYKESIIGTFIVLIWYAYETHKIRKIYAQQKDLSLLPAMMLYLRTRAGEKRLFIRNVGSGTAICVKVTQKVTRVGTERLEYRFNLLDDNSTLTAGEEREVGVDTFVDDTQMTTSLSSFTSQHNPEIFRLSEDLSEKKVKIRYKDITGRPYDTDVVFNKDGIAISKSPKLAS